MSIEHFKVRNISGKVNIRKNKIMTLPVTFSKFGKLQDITVNGKRDEESAAQKKVLNNTNCKNYPLDVIHLSSTAATIVSNKRKSRRRQWKKKLYELNEMKKIKEGQWESYLRHTTALLLHGIQSINKEPAKRTTKNSMKHYLPI